jgi:hypothetical protein
VSFTSFFNIQGSIFYWRNFTKKWNSKFKNDMIFESFDRQKWETNSKTTIILYLVFQQPFFISEVSLKREIQKSKN